MGILENRTAIVTGGATGIGRAIAERFYREGANVVICGRRTELLEESRGRIAGSTSGVPPAEEHLLALRADVTVEEDVDSLIDTTLAQFGAIHILVNNAGIMRFGRLEEATEELWSSVMNVNLYAPWRLMAKVLPHMRNSGGGSIINLSSIAGIRPLSGAGVYCTSKAALQMMSQVLALETAADGIRINTINPGLVEDTELADPIFGSPEKVEEFYARLRPLHPLGRSGRPEDIAEIALFLASEASAWVTGDIIPVDGGRHLATNRPAL